MQNIFKENLIKGSKSLEIRMESFHINAFLRYFNILKEWNQKMNLTSIKTPGDICIKHFLDSLTSLKTIQSCLASDSKDNMEFRLIDVGTGAGFPGIPIKIMIPSLKLTLLESQKKKTMFLVRLVDELELKGIDIVNERAENIGKKEEFREVFDICIARAVAPLNILYEYTLPLIKKNGWFIAMKGKEYEKDLKESIHILELLGGKISHIDKMQLPILEQERSIIVIKKERNTPEEFPRRAGLPKKRPLNI